MFPSEDDPVYDITSLDIDRYIEMDYETQTGKFPLVTLFYTPLVGYYCIDEKNSREWDNSSTAVPAARKQRLSRFG